jgi:hypothetical protein
LFSPYLHSGLLLLSLALLTGCSEPPVPPEIPLALSQEQDLWRSGAPHHAPEAYQRYQQALLDARELHARQNSRFPWKRDAEGVSSAFAQVLKEGEALRTTTEQRRQGQQREIVRRLEGLRTRISSVRQLTERIRDKRLAMRQLSEAEVLLQEANALARGEDAPRTLQRIEQAEEKMRQVVDAIVPLVRRYGDRQQVAEWQQLARETLAESKRTGGLAIVVRKLERRVTVYRAGVPIHHYAAGLGFNFLSDKRHSGDRATPEGKYRVIRKLPASKFYRALLIDYPNAEDQRRFARAKKSGELAAGARIGSLIEIHGGGRNGLTDGCVALDDEQMLELFQLIPVGTPVTIVGTTDLENSVTTFLASLQYQGTTPR